ncbi:MAG: glutamate-5-semialdehyde dehydrogenase [Clostridiales bacterium]|nr:MAG: glutamate-5-semialdehyde dehydrogenase [Clostridiales bacterium]
MKTLTEIGAAAKTASYELANLSQSKKNEALFAIAENLCKNISFILNANSKDIEKAEENGIKKTMIDRLRLTEERINGIAQGVLQVAALPDPIGECLHGTINTDGLKINKIRVPLGVIAIIYEARPNVTVDAAALTLKSGNAAILRGGKEAVFSNIALTKIMTDALKSVGINENAIQLIEDTSRETATELMRLSDYVDVLIPRGGAGLIRSVVENAKVPVIETGTGNCHIYADDDCDLEMAANIVFNAKTQRPSVCNAAESLLVHENIAVEFLPLVKKRLDEKNVEIRGCEKTQSIINCSPASEEDFYTEFLDYIISVKVVSDLNEAINHINKHSTHHSEAIITNNYQNAELFKKKIDSAAVYVNASTRFTDGFVFGLGAEIGISTQKMHARGPMGLNELTTIKYTIDGNGQIRG